MTTRNTPANPRWGTGAPAPRRPEPATPHERGAPHGPASPFEPTPAETDPFSPRVRGRHRKPRPRRALLAVGGLALAAGALSLVRLTSGPGTDSLGSVEAESRPAPVTTTNTLTTGPAAPRVSPSSPTALGGLPPSPGTRGPAAASRTPSTYTATSTGTRRAPTAATPRPAAVPDTTNPPAPPARGNDKAPRSAQTPPSPPNRTAPAPASEPEKPKEPADPGLCVPVIGLCMDSPG
ncbi:hypothetical protein ACF1G5_19845 [Streptomyces coeruleorubidus]|uniref:hypothetical protein n=1 Tax=Streptomyces coeruleorubidus TaxID=116188 RepID=UPI0036FB8FEF